MHSRCLHTEEGTIIQQLDLTDDWSEVELLASVMCGHTWIKQETGEQRREQ